MAEDHGAPEAGLLPRAWTRESLKSEHNERVQSSLVEIERTFVSKNFDETVRPQSEKYG